MEGWLIAAVLLCGAGLYAGSLSLRERRARADGVQLRLLAGRSQLLEEEIERRTEDLAGLDSGELTEHRHLAESAVDQLHALAIERQAHLLNFEDLIHLQQQKIGHVEAAMDASAPAPASARPAERAPDTDFAEPLRDRADVESDLLSKIGQLRAQSRRRSTPGESSRT